MSGQLLLSDNPGEIIDHIFKRLSTHLGLEAYVNYLLNDDGKSMKLVAYSGIPECIAKDIEHLQFGEAVCGCVALYRERMIIEDVQHSLDPRVSLVKSIGITAYVCHPLIARGKLIGTLSFGTRARDRFSKEEIDLLYIVCNQVAMALERSKLIRQLEDARSSLEKRVSERTDDLQKANDALKAEISERIRVEEELRKSKIDSDIYVDIMGHDINNMNQIGIGYLEMALESSSINSHERSMIARSLEMFENSSRLIDNVRKIQKEKSGGLEKYIVDLDSILREVTGLYQEVPGRSVEIRYVPMDNCRVLSNDQLRDVFSHLIDNAIKHSRGIVHDLVIDVELARIVDGNGTRYKISISDNGPGIPDGLKHKIFNKFLQGDIKSRGSGIGLYLVKTILEDSNGNIWVENRTTGIHANGTTFVIILPSANPDGLPAAIYGPGQ